MDESIAVESDEETVEFDIEVVTSSAASSSSSSASYVLEDENALDSCGEEVDVQEKEAEAAEQENKQDDKIGDCERKVEEGQAGDTEGPLTEKPIGEQKQQQHELDDVFTNVPQEVEAKCEESDKKSQQEKVEPNERNDGTQEEQPHGLIDGLAHLTKKLECTEQGKESLSQQPLVVGIEQANEATSEQQENLIAEAPDSIRTVARDEREDKNNLTKTNRDYENGNHQLQSQSLSKCNSAEKIPPKEEQHGDEKDAEAPQVDFTSHMHVTDHSQEYASSGGPNTASLQELQVATTDTDTDLTSQEVTQVTQKLESVEGPPQPLSLSDGASNTNDVAIQCQSELKPLEAANNEQISVSDPEIIVTAASQLECEPTESQAEELASAGADVVPGVEPTALKEALPAEIAPTFNADVARLNDVKTEGEVAAAAAAPAAQVDTDARDAHETITIEENYEVNQSSEVKVGPTAKRHADDSERPQDEQKLQDEEVEVKSEHANQLEPNLINVPVQLDEVPDASACECQSATPLLEQESVPEAKESNECADLAPDVQQQQHAFAVDRLRAYDQQTMQAPPCGFNQMRRSSSAHLLACSLEDEDLEREFDEEPEFESRDVYVKRNQNPRNEYRLGDELGRGKFGTVFRCTEEASGRELAAKFIHMRRREDRDDVEREVAIMSILQHKRLLQLYDAFDDGVQEMCLITELVEGGELFERIVDDDFDLTEKKAAIFMRQICEGVEYMHSKQIVHLDMKPENILCLSRTGIRIKLIDFGLARRLDPQKPTRVMFGTPDFAAPEVLAYETVTLATDMWSVGVICYVLLSGLSPFMGDSDMETMANVMRATFDFNDYAFEAISDLAKDFISKLLVRDASERLKPAECLKHAWLARGGAPLEAAIRERRESTAVMISAHHRLAMEQAAMMAAVAAAAEQTQQAQLTPPVGTASPVPIHFQATRASFGAESSASSSGMYSLDKRRLKRYVVRRKWHKTVHAIMALGRMGANLRL